MCVCNIYQQVSSCLSTSFVIALFKASSVTCDRENVRRSRGRLYLDHALRLEATREEDQHWKRRVLGRYEYRMGVTVLRSLRSIYHTIHHYHLLVCIVPMGKVEILEKAIFISLSTVCLLLHVVVHQFSLLHLTSS